MRKIVIVNAYGDDNRGSAALNSAAIAVASAASAQSEVKLVSIDGTPDLAVQFRHTLRAHPETIILPPPVKPARGPLRGTRTALIQLSYLLFPNSRTLPPTLREIRDADLVLSRGGYFYFGRSTVASTLGLFSTAFPMLFATRTGVPTVMLPQSIGPASRLRVSSAVLGWILRQPDVVVARDPLSQRMARHLGVAEERVMELPDSVLALGPHVSPSPAVESLGGYIAVSARRAQISMGVEDASHLIAEVVSLLIRGGSVTRCVVAPQERPSSYKGQLMSRLIARVEANCGPGSAQLDDRDLSLTELMHLYGGAEATLSHHLHACILSMIAGTPAVAISVDGAKVEGVYRSLGLPREWVVSPSDDPELVADRVIDAANSRELVSGAIESARARLQDTLIPTLQEMMRHL